jgi:hypothetical protein
MLLRSVAPRAAGWWQVADAAGASDPAAERATHDLDLRPLLPLGSTAAGVTAGLLAVPLIRTAASLLGTDYP